MLGLDVAAAAAAGAGAADEHEVIAAPRAELDITDREALAAALCRARPDLVINCAAYTNVDLAERSIETASAVNGDGAGNVARAAAAAGAWTIHVSSDYVFDGTKREPYLESDPVAPASAYGRSKLAGELAVAVAARDSHTIVRSSWLFGAGGPCFPATIRRLAAERDELSVVDDQRGCPTFTGHLAQALLTLAARRPLGIVHVAGSGDCTWFEFAQEIVARSGLTAQVKPTTTAEMERPAPRPAYSVLGTERVAEAPSLPHWRDGLAEYMTATVGTA
jgi:dTDP-4-dehydrorhamnose reductase